MHIRWQLQRHIKRLNFRSKYPPTNEYTHVRDASPLLFQISLCYPGYDGVQRYILLQQRVVYQRLIPNVQPWPVGDITVNYQEGEKKLYNQRLYRWFTSFIREGGVWCCLGQRCKDGLLKAPETNMSNGIINYWYRSHHPIFVGMKVHRK